MLNKIWLYHNINKFYRIFGETIGVHTKLRDLNDTDFLLGVEHDVKTAIEGYMYSFNDESYEISEWLLRLYDMIVFTNRHSHKPILKATAIILAIATALIVGLHIGRLYTICQAELLETTNDTYFIGFGDEVHEYTFEEVR